TTSRRPSRRSGVSRSSRTPSRSGSSAESERRARASRVSWCPGSDFMSEPGDKDLVLRARTASGREAFRALHERHSPGVFAFVAHLTGDDSLAGDVLLDIFLRAHRSLERYDEERSFRAWLLGTARDSALDALRIRAKTEAPKPAAPGLAPEQRALVVQR